MLHADLMHCAFEECAMHEIFYIVWYYNTSPRYQGVMRGVITGEGKRLEWVVCRKVSKPRQSWIHAYTATASHAVAHGRIVTAAGLRPREMRRVHPGLHIAAPCGLGGRGKGGRTDNNPAQGCVQPRWAMVADLAGRWSQLSHSEKVLRERRPVLVRLPMPRDAKKPPRAAHRCTGWFRGKGEGRTALRRAAACLCSVSHLRYGQDCK